MRMDGRTPSSGSLFDKDLSDSHLKVVSLVDSEDGDGKFTEEAMEAIGHTTLENALGYEKGEIPTGNQV